MKNRTLYFGDNLKVLREKFPSDAGYFDLVYLDPPFNSQQTYNVLFKEGLVESEAQVAAFEDTWHWTREAQTLFDELCSHPRYPESIGDVMQGIAKVVGHNDMMAYLTMMTVRLVELHRVLKETGSLYLHCDPTASHYLKIVLDAVFGKECYRNEIIWKRTNARSTDKRWPRVHDSILFYTKSATFTYAPLQVPADKAKLPHTLITWSDGLKYQTYELTGAGVTRDGESGKPWRGFDPTAMGRHWGNTQAQMDAWDAAGLIHWAKEGKSGGFPRRRAEEPFDEESRTVMVGDVWTDIDRINQSAKERLGYPTQKPQALLERIVLASTNEGDWVLDPFGGCGTTVAAAEALRRNWVLIDITTLSINLVKRRIEKMYPDKVLEMTVDGLPADRAGAVALFERDPFEFEYWCCDLVNARPAGGKSKGKMKGADRGIDGIITLIDSEQKGQTVYRKVIVQVKGGGVKSGDIRDLRGTLEREKAVGAVLITLQPASKPMEKEATEAGSFTYALSGAQYPVIQILTVDQLLHGTKPNLPTQVSYAKVATEADQKDQQDLF